MSLATIAPPGKKQAFQWDRRWTHVVLSTLVVFLSYDEAMNLARAFIFIQSLRSVFKAVKVDFSPKILSPEDLKDAMEVYCVKGAATRCYGTSEAIRRSEWMRKMVFYPRAINGYVEEGSPSCEYIAKFPNLTDLDMKYCVGLKQKHMDAIAAHCKYLQKLSIGSGMWNMDLSGFSCSTELKSISFFRGDFSELPNVFALPDLNELVFESCRLHNLIYIERDLSRFHLLRELPKLQKLHVIGCSISSAVHLSYCSNLVELCLTFMSSLEDLKGIGTCKNLETLVLCENRNLKKVDGISACGKLEHLDLSMCSALEDVSCLSSCTSLRYLDLKCTSVENISFLASMVHLKSLILSHCTFIRDISVLAECDKLELLDFDGHELDEISSLGCCSSLTTLYLCGSDKNVSLSGLARSSSLTELDMSGCSNQIVFDFSDGDGFNSLEWLSLEGCNSLRHICSSQRWPNMKFMCLNNCERLRDFSFLDSCVNLTDLQLTRCHKFDSFQLLHGLNKLEKLTLSDCRRNESSKDDQKTPNIGNVKIEHCSACFSRRFLGREAESDDDCDY